MYLGYGLPFLIHPNPCLRRLVEKVDTPLSGKKEKKISQLRSPKPVSVNDGHENDNGPSEQEEVRATSLSEELQALLSGLDSAMGGLKKK